MKINRSGHSAAVLSLAACLCAASAFGAGGTYPQNAEEAITGALANLKSRYRAKLDHYGLTESYFDETSGICDLMLLDVQSWTKYQIVYYWATDEISWPRMMPKGVLCWVSTCPVPLQAVQVFALVPFAAPLPLHSEHF